MDSRVQWRNAATSIREESSGHENRLALAEFCQSVAESPLCYELEINTEWLPNRIYIKKSHGAFPSKMLKLESITENRIEICWSDNSTNSEKYFFPHTPARSLVERAMYIVNELDWSREVVQFNGPIDWIAQKLGRQTKP